MTRTAKLIVGGLLLIVVLLAAHAAQAQDAAATTNDGWPTYKFQRGPGFYLDTFKILLAWALFALWVKTTNWCSQDCIRLHLNYVVWNLIVFVPFVLSFILLWVLPIFAVGFPLMLLAYFAPLQRLYRDAQPKGADRTNACSRRLTCGICSPEWPEKWACK